MEKFDENGLVLIIGSHGTIGKALVPLMEERGLYIYTPTHSHLNLLDQVSIYKTLEDARPNYIINLAARKTNIFLNSSKPADICSDTIEMNLNLLKVCTMLQTRKYFPKKIINIISSCAYGEAPILKEENFFKGNINPSISPHGEAKRMVYLLGQMYRKQYNIPIVNICLNNIYGGADWKKLDQLKVADSLIKRFVDAKINNGENVTLFGTGTPRRELLYFRDAAEGILQTLQKYDSEEILNLGNGYDISIKDLANDIALTIDYKGGVEWDTTTPDGQLKKLFDVQKMKTLLEWSPPTSLSEGIIATVLEYTLARKTNV